LRLTTQPTSISNAGAGPTAAIASTLKGVVQTIDLNVFFLVPILLSRGRSQANQYDTNIPIKPYMCIGSKIYLAGGLRLLSVATVVVFANLGSLVSDIQGQVLGQPREQAPRQQVALPNFFVPDKNAPMDSNPRPNQIAPALGSESSLVDWDAPINPTAGPAPLDYVPSSGVQAVDQSVMRMAHGLANDVQHATPSLNHSAEAFPVAGSRFLTPTMDGEIVNYVRPSGVQTVDQSAMRMAHGLADTNDVQLATPSLNHSAEVFPAEDSRFLTPEMNGEIVIEQNSLELQSVPQILKQPVNQTSEGSGLLAAYQSRSHLQQSEGFQETQLPRLPQGFQPWWSQENKIPLRLKVSPVSVSLDSLIQRALANSPHIQVAATQPHIQKAVLLEESSRFDWLSFLESKYDDQNDPIGNTLTTGNNDSRFQQQEWYSEGGLRRQTRSGGEFEFSQRISTLQNNSQFQIPEEQGSSRLVLNYRQPILRGRGRAVNESLILLANINLDAASDELLNNIQQHLTDLTETYWELVRARSELLQRSKLLIAAEKILIQLEGRAEVDALDRQVFRARSAVAKRKAEIARSVTSVKNAESRIRLLVNDHEIINAAGMELVPVDVPNLEFLGISLGDAISTALSNRPDISRSIREITATSIQLGIARNDLLPQLDLLVGSYVAGLDDDFDILGAKENQFTDGRPGFNIGFEFEAPIGNRAAQARQSRREWEANRAMHQFRAVVESGLTEVELAVREVQTAHQEMNGRYHAMVAAEKESSYLSDRWKTLPDESDSVTLLLENLLDSQERLVNEESAFAKAQFDYSVAVVKLKQATGTLFQVN